MQEGGLRLAVTDDGLHVSFSYEIWQQIVDLLEGSTEWKEGEPYCWYERDEAHRVVKFSRGHWTRMMSILMTIGTAEAYEMAEELRIAHYLHWYQI